MVTGWGNINHLTIRYCALVPRIQLLPGFLFVFLFYPEQYVMWFCQPLAFQNGTCSGVIADKVGNEAEQFFPRKLIKSFLLFCTELAFATFIFPSHSCFPISRNKILPYKSSLLRCHVA